MGRGRGRGPQRPIKGFRPGKEPPELRKLRAQEQFGEMSGAQRQLVELFASRTPAESRALIRRWTVGLLAGGVALLIAAIALFLWSAVAGSVVGLLAVVVLVLWLRIRTQREALETMADTVSGPGRAGRKRRK